MHELDFEMLANLIPFETTDHVQVGGVRNAAVYDEHSVVDDGTKRQPTVHAFN